jgi:hypothetical protein
VIYGEDSLSLEIKRKTASSSLLCHLWRYLKDEQNKQAVVDDTSDIVR